jgi:hypothetical protein
LNICDQTSPYVLDVESSFNQDGKFSGKFQWKRNDKMHLYFHESSMIMGGNHKYVKDRKGTREEQEEDPIHQICHRDCDTEDDQLTENQKLVGLDFPMSAIIPLQDDRTIYVGIPDNLVEVSLGQYLVFLGNLAHGGITRVLLETDPGNLWKCSLHIHLDSKHHT